MMKKLAYYFSWVVKCKLKGYKIPLTGSIILTDKCNLKCKHCSVSNLGYPNLSFGEVKRDVKRLYDLGVRMLIITGGEPFVWRAGERTLEDVVKYAKSLGFFRVVVCTNGTYPLTSFADYLWVSLDGFPTEHIKLRGNIYGTVIKNIHNSNHKGIYINFVVSKINLANFEKAIDKILEIKNIRGLLLFTFTPYIDCDKSLMLSEKERCQVGKKFLQIKKKYPIKISNTYNGLKAFQRNDWERPIWSSVVINQGKITPCCCREGIYDQDTCFYCGCTPAIETYMLEKLKPLAILEYLKFL